MGVISSVGCHVCIWLGSESLGGGWDRLQQALDILEMKNWIQLN